MPSRTTTFEQRLQIIEDHLQGKSLSQIGAEMRLNRYTTRKWWRRYKSEGWNGLVSHYGRKSKGALSQFDSRIKYVVLRLKLEHPGWGLDLLLLHMSRRPSLSGKALPSRTALHNYLCAYYARFRARPRYPTTRPAQNRDSPKRAHVRWQMDFKGSEKVKGLGQVMSFNICDEFSSAPLKSVIYCQENKNPLSDINWRDIQQNLRSSFCQWGKPLSIKMDRDPLFIGSTRFEWPGPLLLWLIGLGITPQVNRAATPTDNAQIERSNLTWLNHVGRTSLTYTSREQLQQDSDQAWQDRRNHLPSRNPNCRNKAPLVALPDLAHSNRYFSPEKETQQFNIDHVYNYLSQWKWKRKVDTLGRISLGGNQRTISKKLIGQIVKIEFIHKTSLFQVYDLQNNKIKELMIPNISTQFLIGGTT